MKKIIMYSVRPDEEPAIKEWSDQHDDVQVDTQSVAIDPQTVAKAQGYDGLSVLQTGDMKDEAVFKALHDFGFKQIAVRSTGYENYDLNLATKYGLTVTNVPAYSPRSVAEMALAHTMALLRHLPKIAKQEAQHNFSWAGLEAPEIHNLTVGIVGVGKIGYTVARIFKALGATVIGNDIYHRPDVQDTLNYVDLDTLLQQADVITMHTPLLKSTEHLISAPEFKKMKNSAIFINASRGGVVNTDDLIAALKNHEIAAAGLDTVEDEAAFFGEDLSNQKTLSNPYIDQLLALPNVSLTPHVGFYTDMAVKNMVSIALDNVYDTLTGKKPFSPVN